MSQVVLQVAPLISVALLQRITAALPAPILLQHVLLVQPHKALFQLFVILDLQQHILHIRDKFTLIRLLLINGLPELVLLTQQPMLPHAQIFNNQKQVVVHSRKVLDFLLHLVGLLAQFSDLVFPRINVTL